MKLVLYEWCCSGGLRGPDARLPSASGAEESHLPSLMTEAAAMLRGLARDAARDPVLEVTVLVDAELPRPIRDALAAEAPGRIRAVPAGKEIDVLVAEAARADWAIVVAPETAAHAAGTAALLPMLTLGVPGSPTAAVLLGGLLIWGLQPGPLLFVEKPEFVWGLIASMYLGNIAGLIVVLTTVPLFAAILRIPFAIIAPIIMVVCAIGAYTVHSSMLDVYLMVVFGILGYLFRKLDYPLAPLVLALVLGDRAEAAFRQSMLLSEGSLSVFFSNFLVGSLTGLGLLLLFWPLFAWFKRRLDH